MSDEVDLRSILDLLRRRIRLVALTVLVALGTAGMALLLLPPVYTATALVLVDPSKKNLLDSDAQLGATGSDSFRVDSEVELVKAEPVLLAVARELDLVADPEFAPRHGWRDTLLNAFGVAPPPLPTGDEALRAAAGKLREAVGVQRRGLTFLIAVTGQSRRPELAAEIANAVARHYIQGQLEAKVASTLAARDIIQARIADAAAAVAAAEHALHAFVEANLEQLGDATGRTDLVALRSEIETLADAAAVPPSTRLPPRILTALYELRQNAEVSRAGYRRLLARQGELDTQAFLQVADSRVVSEATPPAAPSQPNPSTLLLVAGAGGVVMGILVAVVAENFIGGFTSQHQAGAVLKVPVVAAVPRQRLAKRGGVDALSLADSLKAAPLSAFSESIRRIRIGLEQVIRRGADPDRAAPEEGAVIVVSSAAPDEGKTTVALSLARAYALSGVSTLLVDCDLRRPAVHRQLGMAASEGLFDYLRGADATIELKDITTVDTVSGAQVIFGARRSEVATDQLIAGSTFTHLLRAARQSFEVVILDTPPVGLVVDGLYLAGMADAILCVVKWSATPQQEVRSAVSALLGARRQSTPVLAVLNQLDTSPRSYRGKYSDDYAEA